MDQLNFGQNLQNYIIEQENIEANKEGKVSQILKVFRELLTKIQLSIKTNNPIEKDQHLTELVKLFEVIYNFQDREKVNEVQVKCYELLYEAIFEILQSEEWSQKTIALLTLKNSILNFPQNQLTHIIVEKSFPYLTHDENKLRELSCEVLVLQFGQGYKHIKRSQKYLKESQDGEQSTKIEDLEKQLINQQSSLNELIIQIKSNIHSKYHKVDVAHLLQAKLVQDQEQEQYLREKEDVFQQKYIDINIRQYDGAIKTYAESFLQLFLGLFKTDVLVFDMSQSLSSDATSLEQDILNILEISMLHAQKFIRDTSIQIIQTILQKVPKSKQAESNEQILVKLRDFIIQGLADDYTNVRVQAMRCAFTFVVYTQKNQKYIQPLLAYLCFNRHHPAEGLHTYSRQTWFEVFGQSGRDLMAANLEFSIEYYYKQCFNRNYEIRNAAAICFQELIMRIVNTNETTFEIFYKLINKVVLGLVNCIYYEVNSIVREETTKTLISVLEYKDKINQDFVLELLEKAVFFHLPDQSSVVKQNVATILLMLQKQDSDRSELKAKILKELSNVSDKEIMGKELVNVEKYVKNISKEALMVRHMADYLEGYTFMAREFVVRDPSKSLEQVLEFIQAIVTQLSKIEFQGTENIISHVIQIIDNMVQLLDKKYTKSSIEIITGPLIRCAKYRTQNDQINVLLPFANVLFSNIARKIGVEILKGRLREADMGRYEKDIELFDFEAKVQQQQSSEQ